MPKTSWTLDEILELLAQPPVSQDTVRRCLEPMTGRGRFVRTNEGQTSTADVTMKFDPAPTFLVTIRLEGVDSDQAVARQSILRVILEGTSRSHPPAWGCHIECVEVNAQPFSADTIAIAASLAVQDALTKSGWDPSGPPGQPVTSARTA